ncbi:hypothetical protein PPTG_24518 [Phytophthora nicotianae INRA-310]|uniref:Uncharacterized protein n=1 Tax=Phytophthora nicotianae (strain INRA-310) TaxID=761204 RepID=W2PDP7_PHYN3|nr:hypothetical protein PPTG_24518 [Phytophthora nicotianae INRA-310]ETM98971.1 hypothetical protein PPTG_24518 [Phytophthora nicotianae INRA-310]
MYRIVATTTYVYLMNLLLTELIAVEQPLLAIAKAMSSAILISDLINPQRAVKVTVEKPYSMLKVRISMSVMIMKTKPTPAETFNMTKVNPTRKIDHQAGCPMLLRLQIQQVYQTDNRFNSFSAVKTSPA